MCIPLWAGVGRSPVLLGLPQRPPSLSPRAPVHLGARAPAPPSLLDSDRLPAERVQPFPFSGVLYLPGAPGAFRRRNGFSPLSGQCSCCCHSNRCWWEDSVTTHVGPPAAMTVSCARRCLVRLTCGRHHRLHGGLQRLSTLPEVTWLGRGRGWDPGCMSSSSSSSPVQNV